MPFNMRARDRMKLFEKVGRISFDLMTYNYKDMTYDMAFMSKKAKF